MCHGLILGPEGLEPAQPRRIFQCRLWHQADGYVTALPSLLFTSTMQVRRGTSRAITADSRESSPHVQFPFSPSWCILSHLGRSFACLTSKVSY